MKKFTTNEEYPHQYSITKENFENLTEKKKPYYVANKDGVKQYALCPLCKNPIKIINLYQKAEKSNKTEPYGSHAGKKIPGFPKWNYDNYLWCQYKRKSVSFTEPPYEDNLSDRQIHLYNFVREEIDAIVYVIEQTLDVKCGLNFWKDILDRFVKSKVYGYVWINIYNVPYMIMNFVMLQKNLYGQQIKKNSNLYNVLKKHPNVVFVKSQYNKDYELLQSNKFIDLSFHFWNYKYHLDSSQNLHETMDFAILENGKDEIYKTNIVFDQEFLGNVINSKNRKRDYKLLEYAKEVMPPIIT